MDVTIRKQPHIPLTAILSIFFSFSLLAVERAPKTITLKSSAVERYLKAKYGERKEYQKEFPDISELLHFETEYTKSAAEIAVAVAQTLGIPVKDSIYDFSQNLRITLSTKKEEAFEITVASIVFHEKDGKVLGNVHGLTVKKFTLKKTLFEKLVEFRATSKKVINDTVDELKGELAAAGDNLQKKNELMEGFRAQLKVIDKPRELLLDKLEAELKKHLEPFGVTNASKVLRVKKSLNATDMHFYTPIGKENQSLVVSLSIQWFEDKEKLIALKVKLSQLVVEASSFPERKK